MCCTSTTTRTSTYDNFGSNDSRHVTKHIQTEDTMSSKNIFKSIKKGRQRRQILGSCSERILFYWECPRMLGSIPVAYLRLGSWWYKSQEIAQNNAWPSRLQMGTLGTRIYFSLSPQFAHKIVVFFAALDLTNDTIILITTISTSIAIIHSPPAKCRALRRGRPPWCSAGTRWSARGTAPTVSCSGWSDCFV